jgi:hypothetical protein
MRGVFVVLLVLTTVSIVQGSDHWPPQVPEPTGWMFETGSAVGSKGQPMPVVLANATVEYALYSSPDRPMLFGISNYSVTPRRQTGLFAGQGQTYRGREVVVWMTGERGSASRIFVRVSYRSVRTLWLSKRWRWVELPIRSPEWMFEQGVALRLWSVHALIRHHGNDPVSVQF